MGIRFKLQAPFIAITLILFATIAGLYFYWIPQVDERAFVQLEHATLSEMQLSAETIAPALEDGNIALIQDELRTIHDQHPHWIELTLRDRDGVRLYPLFGLRPITRDPKQQDIGDASAYRQSLHMTLPIKNRLGDAIGYLQVSADNYYMEQQEHRTILLTLTILSVMVAYIISIGLFLMERWFNRPLRDLLAATHRITVGDYDSPIKTLAHDEIGLLASHFNQMRSKVHNRELSLQDATHEAEKLRDTYAALSELNAFIAERPSPPELIQRSASIMQRALKPDLIWIARVDWDDLSLKCEHISHPSENHLDHGGIEQAISAIRIGDNHATNIFQQIMIGGGVRCVPSLFEEQGLGSWWVLLSRLDIDCMLVAPIMTDGHVSRIVALFGGEKGVCEPRKIKLLEELSERMGLSLEDHAKDQELQWHAHYDPLTQLPNRTLFMGHLTELRSKSLMHAQEQHFAVGILDLHGLKSINDRLGHQSGDIAIRELANRLITHQQPGDLIARLNGDEFGLILFPARGDPHWQHALKRLLEDLTAPFLLPEGESIEIQSHIGLAMSPTDGKHPESLLRRADLALQEAKSNEVSCYRFFTPAMEEQMLRRYHVQHEFMELIEKNGLELHYQPQMDIAASTIIGYEALIRWPLPEGGYRPVSEFITQVELDGRLIRALGCYVIRNALAQLETWKVFGYATTVSVNIGARHLLAPEFLQDLDHNLARHESVRHALKIEITETAYLNDLGKTAKVLHACHKRGIKVSLDDFGTGYASLSYLQRLPCDQIKIDQSFIRQIFDVPQNQAIVAALITAARQMDLEVIAEGVETTAHAIRLLEMGCLTVQGYAASKPMPADQVIPWAQAQIPNVTLPEWARAAVNLYDCRLLAIAAEHHLSACNSCEFSANRAFSDISAATTGDQTCRFNLWYEREGRETYGEHPEFERLGQAHERTHKIESASCQLCRTPCHQDPSSSSQESIPHDTQAAQSEFLKLFWEVVSPEEYDALITSRRRDSKMIGDVG
ncbi:hypothetical protein BJI67_10095 [Acidihalobacter aeolianus]|uniref:Diguanylate cyclase n=1 Tax=Acidihalobacter aeolianus TaxID=2792603 RepID=A0A1D8K8V2_9GAMM|nr:EAL domain-containing protein [Acidihalobacter aeolianus]AOV17361.1 hypothetical protein BJI67_10095 [Acidihalobacter aeolianus]